MFKERLDALIKEGEGTLSRWHDILDDYAKEIEAEKEKAVQDFLSQEFPVFADEDSNLPDGVRQKTVTKAKWIDGRFVSRNGTGPKGTVLGEITTAMMGTTPRKIKKEKTPQVEMVQQPPPPPLPEPAYGSVELPDPAFIIPGRNIHRR